MRIEELVRSIRHYNFVHYKELNVDIFDELIHYMNGDQDFPFRQEKNARKTFLVLCSKEFYDDTAAMLESYEEKVDDYHTYRSFCDLPYSTSSYLADLSFMRGEYDFHLVVKHIDETVVIPDMDRVGYRNCFLIKKDD